MKKTEVRCSASKVVQLFKWLKKQWDFKIRYAEPLGMVSKMSFPKSIH